MDYDRFMKEIRSLVKEKMSGDCTVELHTARKNNGVLMDSIVIRRSGDNICPNIYLDQVYRAFRSGLSLEKCAQSIVDSYADSAPAFSIDAGTLVNDQTIREQVVYRLVNYSRNSDLLEQVPHERFLDLALIYYIMVHNEEFGDGAIMVRNDFLSCYGVTAEELEEAARQNTHRLLPADFVKITDLLREFGEKSGAHSYSDITLEEDSTIVPLYVLTNKTRQYGAYYMTDTDMLGKISERLGTDLYVLPSSVHECMVIPADMWEDTDSLKDMVYEINHTQVSEDEYLADTVYLFRRRGRSLIIAA